MDQSDWPVQPAAAGRRCPLTGEWVSGTRKHGRYFPGSHTLSLLCPSAQTASSTQQRHLWAWAGRAGWRGAPAGCQWLCERRRHTGQECTCWWAQQWVSPKFHTSVLHWWVLSFTLWCAVHGLYCLSHLADNHNKNKERTLFEGNRCCRRLHRGFRNVCCSEWKSYKWKI